MQKSNKIMPHHPRLKVSIQNLRINLHQVQRKRKLGREDSLKTERVKEDSNTDRS